MAGHDQPRPDGDQTPTQTPPGWAELPLLDAAERLGLTTEALREWAEQRRIAHRTAARRADYGELDEAGDADHPQGVTLREWAEQRRIAYRTVPGRAAVR